MSTCISKVLVEPALLEEDDDEEEEEEEERHSGCVCL